MPNWCQNTLTVTGDKEQLEKFKNAVKEGDIPLAFENTVPIPEDVEDWYNWRLKNWGTKWDLDNETDFVDVSDYHSFLEYNFFTAWGPPIEWLENTCVMFSDLNFEISYSEPGMGFMGRAVFIEGEKIYDESVDIP